MQVSSPLQPNQSMSSKFGWLSMNSIPDTQNPQRINSLTLVKPLHLILKQQLIKVFNWTVWCNILTSHCMYWSIWHQQSGLWSRVSRRSHSYLAGSIFQWKEDDISASVLSADSDHGLNLL